MNLEFRLVGPADEAILAGIFTDIDEALFRLHLWPNAQGTTQ